MEQKRNRRTLFLALLGLVAIALLGAIWAWTTREGCGSCGGVRDLAGSSSLAPVGMAYYAALLIAGVAFGPSRFLYGGVILAAAAHLALLLLLIQRGVFCPPCVVTGLAAILGAGISFVIDPSNLARAGFLVPAGAIGAHLALFWSGGIMTPNLAPGGGASPLAQSIQKDPPLGGKARMTVFSRSGCPYCVELEDKIIPNLRLEFGDRLDVRREEAPAGIPTPTIVIAGVKGTVFPGLPPTEALKSALWSAMGGERHEPSVLSKP